MVPDCYLADGTPSVLTYGDLSIFSQTGPPEGDPLGPLFLCLPLQPLLSRMACALVSGYLDDLTLENDVELIMTEASSLGLALNIAKCQVGSQDLHNYLLLYRILLKHFHSNCI